MATISESWTGDGPWNSNFVGKPAGSDVSIIFNDSSEPGGPRLHKHPYTETFVVREGKARFFAGDDVIEAVAGQIVVVPADIPHRFENLGDQLVMVNIHASPTFETVWL